MFAPMRRLPLAIASFLLLVVSGCATMLVPGIQQVPVASTPEGAEVFIDGELVGTTPVLVEVTSNERHEVVVRLGDEELAWTLEPQVGAAGAVGIAGDILILVPTGLVGAGLVAAGPEMEQQGWEGIILLGLSMSAVAITPLAIDLATNQFYELVPAEIEAVF